LIERRERRMVMWLIIAYASPVAIYASIFWEHTLATGLGLASAAIALRVGSLSELPGWRRCIGWVEVGLLLSASIYLRLEMIIFALALLGACWLVLHDQRWQVLWAALAMGAILLPYLPLQNAMFGRAVPDNATYLFYPLRYLRREGWNALPELLVGPFRDEAIDPGWRGWVWSVAAIIALATSFGRRKARVFGYIELAGLAASAIIAAAFLFDSTAYRSAHGLLFTSPWALLGLCRAREVWDSGGHRVSLIGVYCTQIVGNRMKGSTGNAAQSTDRRQYCTTALVFLRKNVYPSSSDHRFVALGGSMAGRRIDTVDIRELVRHLRDTTNDSAVQRATGLNRRTIVRYRRWADSQGLLAGPLLPIEQFQALITTTLTPPPPPQTTSSVEPYRDVVLQLHRDGVDGTAIRERIGELGFAGSVSAIYRFLHRLAPTEPDVTVRVETAPGEEAQVDFGYAGKLLDPETGLKRKAWAFVMTLSWSRHQYVEFVWDQTVATWLTLHRHAFEYFGGAPKRIKLDNLKAAITKACVDDPQVQQAYRECAEHYGFLIDPCRPRTPEHKGKVESGVKYVKRNFLGGRKETSITQANADVLDWCGTTAGQRRHGTTKEQPLTRFTTTERGVLLPLPASPYDLAIWKVATVRATVMWCLRTPTTQCLSVWSPSRSRSAAAALRCASTRRIGSWWQPTRRPSAPANG
jgi:transposase